VEPSVFAGTGIALLFLVAVMFWQPLTRPLAHRLARRSHDARRDLPKAAHQPAPRPTSFESALASAYRDHHLLGTAEFELVTHPDGSVLVYPYLSTHEVGTTFAVLTEADFDRYGTVDRFVAGMLEACGEVWRARIAEVERINAGL